MKSLVILSAIIFTEWITIFEKHHETNADLTVSVIPQLPADAESFGLLKTDESGRIVQFREKPKGDALEEMRVDTTRFGLDASSAEKRPFLASMGIYVFNYEKLVELLNRNEDAVDFGGEIIPAAINEYNVQAHLFNDYWEDIGTIRAFYEANLDLVSPLPKFILTPTPDIPAHAFAAVKGSRMRHRQSMVSEGSILNGMYARN